MMMWCRPHTAVFPTQSDDVQLELTPTSPSGAEVKLREAAHELNEEKRKSARRKKYESLTEPLTLLHYCSPAAVDLLCIF